MNESLLIWMNRNPDMVTDILDIARNQGEAVHRDEVLFALNERRQLGLVFKRSGRRAKERPALATFLRRQITGIIDLYPEEFYRWSRKPKHGSKDIVWHRREV